MTNGTAAQSRPDTLFETYGDWAVRCQPSQDASGTTSVCEIYQELRQQDSGQRVLSIGIVSTGDVATATIIAPFGIRLESGLKLTLGGALLQDAVFETCMPAGCVAKTEMTPDTIERMKQGNTVEAIMTAHATSEQVSVSVSLKGFTMAWKRLGEL